MLCATFIELEQPLATKTQYLHLLLARLLQIQMFYRKYLEQLQRHRHFSMTLKNNKAKNQEQ